MTLIPTWDLFILVFFAIIVTYSFIIGRDQTVKIVIASYISILTADGIGNLLHQYFFQMSPVFPLNIVPPVNNYTIVAKVIVFSILIIVLMLKGNFAADVADGGSSLLSMVITAFMGILSAGLIISAILVYISGGSFLAGISIAGSDLASSIYTQSTLAKLLIDNTGFWFTLPCVGFIIGSIANK